MAVPVETLTIELNRTTHAFPILSLFDRRGRKPYRRKQWCLIRAIEKLTHDVRTRSAGAFANHLQACSMADSILVAQKSEVTSGVLLQEEFDAGTLSHTRDPNATMVRAQTCADVHRPSGSTGGDAPADRRCGEPHEGAQVLARAADDHDLRPGRVGKK